MFCSCIRELIRILQESTIFWIYFKIHLLRNSILHFIKIYKCITHSIIKEFNSLFYWFYTFSHGSGGNKYRLIVWYQLSVKGKNSQYESLITRSCCYSRHQKTYLEINSGNVPKSHAKYFIHIYSRLIWSSAHSLLFRFAINVAPTVHFYKRQYGKPFSISRSFANIFIIDSINFTLSLLSDG